MREENLALHPSPWPAMVSTKRLRFHVELKENETTVISWKKLLKDSQRPDRDPSSIAPELPAGAHPALEARIAPEAPFGRTQFKNDVLPPPANRFSAVIEKIEKLYKGQSSDDEELGNGPDDDQYDTEDSFIDDEELDEYFSVDKLKTKHSGFFINRGKLESLSEHTSSPVHVPRKRKRRDSKAISSKNTHEEMPKKVPKSGNVRLKAAARSAPLTGPQVISSGESRSSFEGSGKLLEKAKTGEMQIMNTEIGKFSSRTTKSHKYLEDSKKADRISSLHSEKKELKSQADVKNVVRANGNAQALTKDDHVKVAKLIRFDDIGIRHPEKTSGDSVDGKAVKNSRDSTELVSATKLKTMEKHGKNDGADDNNASRSKLSSSKVDNPRRELKSTIKPRKSSYSSAAKDESQRKSKSSQLEKAIHDLRHIVAELRPRTLGSQDEGQVTQGVKRRLPLPIRLHLGNVARLAVSQGKISREIIERLMSIVGHLVQFRTLKRSLYRMIEKKTSDRLDKERKKQHIKREVADMVKMRVSSLKSKSPEQCEGSSDDFQGQPEYSVKGGLTGSYKWDEATEDRLCDLCDEYLEDLDENNSQRVKKLYMELAELWPKGWMDKNSIKNAIHRARLRKRKSEVMEKKKSSTGKPETVEIGRKNSLNESTRAVKSSASYSKTIELDSAQGIVMGKESIQPNYVDLDTPTTEGERKLAKRNFAK